MPTKADIKRWKEILKDPNIGNTVKEHYKAKLRKAGVKVD